MFNYDHLGYESYEQPIIVKRPIIDIGNDSITSLLFFVNEI